MGKLKSPTTLIQAAEQLAAAEDAVEDAKLNPEQKPVRDEARAKAKADGEPRRKRNSSPSSPLPFHSRGYSTVNRLFCRAVGMASSCAPPPANTSRIAST